MLRSCSRAPSRSATVARAHAPRPATLRLMPRKHTSTAAPQKTDSMLNLASPIFTEDAHLASQRLEEMSRLLSAISKEQERFPPMEHEHGPNCNHDHDHGHHHLNPELVRKVRPLNAKLIREFIKYPTWLVHGKKVDGGDQALLIPSEAAQGYLLPLFSSEQKVQEFHEWMQKSTPGVPSAPPSTVSMSGFKIALGLLPSLRKQYQDQLKAVLVDPGQDTMGSMQFAGDQIDELLELSSGMYIERLLKRREFNHAHLQGFPLWVLKSEDGKKYITSKFEGASCEWISAYTTMDMALSFMYTTPEEDHEGWGWARVPYSHVLKDAGSRNQGIAFNYLSTNAAEADDYALPFLLAPQNAKVDTDKLKAIGPVVTLDDALGAAKV